MVIIYYIKGEIGSFEYFTQPKGNVIETVTKVSKKV